MKLVRENFCKIPIWVQFHKLPLELWSAQGISNVDSAIGVLLYADNVIEKFQRLSFSMVVLKLMWTLYFQTLLIFDFLMIISLAYVLNMRIVF